MKIAFIFPGQGSQAVGMGKELYHLDTHARSAIDRADAAFGGGLKELCFEGPEEELKKTPVTQPALVATSVACFKAIEARGIRPDIVGGHSVGEYSALVAAGSLQLEDAIRLTQLRGRLMEASCPAGTGSMAALTGMDRATAQSLCDAVKEAGVAEVAALNTPGQIVLAGHVTALTALIQLAKEKGLGTATMLAVSGPFHSSLMGHAEDGLRDALASVPFAMAQIPVVNNVDARSQQDPDALKTALIGQVTQPVLWQATVEAMVAAGVDAFVEIGAGRVLSGLVRKINRKLTCHSVRDTETLEQTVEALKTAGYAFSNAA
jgi:[acyl-carrier-protein] S-malonyltransferase